ncbi:MAG: type III-B CRISPR module-associated protein Cmr5 [Brevinematia bacterium]|jgi:CRISPR type III-B/RAMP module-associated protein Cmr5
MSERKIEVVKYPVEIFDEVYDKILRHAVQRDKFPKEMEKSLRQRSREIPSLIQEIGLIGALSYCFSKGYKYYPQILDALKGVQRIDDLAKETDAGYSIYLYFLLRGIEQIKILDVDHTKPYEAIKELSNNLDRARIIERLIMSYLVEIKRLCEGSLRSGEER